MPTDHNTLMTDDYVAELLAKEASTACAKYSAVGLEAFRSNQGRSDPPKAKPNTNFLGRIIKETTSHNAALLARESAEAQARLVSLKEAEEAKQRRKNPSASDIRRRQLGDISSILSGSRKRKTAETDDRDAKSGRRRERDEHKDTPVHRRSRREKEKEEESGDADTRHRRRHDSRSQSPDQRKHRYRQRSPAPSDSDGGELRRDHKRTRDGDLFAGRLEQRDRLGRLERKEEPEGTAGTARRKLKDHKLSPPRDVASDDSDPLEDLIGPLPPSQVPPVRARGRGAAARGAKVLDGPLSDDHETKLGGAPTTEGWDEEVEAYRDQQKWKQQGADRLRAAGFTEDQIKKWEKGGEQDVDDVRWTKAGEKREWDRGKDEE